jgi:hypothetical protein
MTTTRLILLLAAALLCWAAPLQGQTIKSLGYNSTNGNIVAATNVVWTNAFSFSTNTVAAQVRTNLGLGSTWLTNTNVTNFQTAIGLGILDSVQFSNATVSTLLEVRTLFVNDSTNQVRVQFEEPANAKTFVRNLTGSTNTNHPFSGTFNFNDPEANADFAVTVSNGIILSVIEF